jgi:putative DNA-invertase from lambdoid prophage Rac
MSHTTEPLSTTWARTMTATFAYLRVSKNDDVMTTANQRLELEQAGYRIDFWHEDTISGSTNAMGRPGFAAMLEKMRDGETLIVSKLDRLGRDAIDVIATVRMLAHLNIRVIVHSLGGVDLASPTGKLLVTMLAAVAEMERDLLIERTNAGVARARSEGKAIGRPPKTSPKQREDMLTSLAAGATVSAMARKFDISRATVIAARTAHQQAAKAARAGSCQLRAAQPAAEFCARWPSIREDRRRYGTCYAAWGTTLLTSSSTSART